MSLAACAGIVERGDPDRFLATMAAPPGARARLWPLYAFNVEVSRAPWVTREPLIAEMRLQWWSDALGEIASGGPVRSHEVATPLSEVLDAEGARALDRTVAARRADAHRTGPADEEALDRHIADTAGELLRQAVRLLGAEGGEKAAGDAGWAQGIANWLLAVPALEAAGVAPLWPGADPAALARKGLRRLASARRSGVPRAARPAMLAAWRAGGVLARAERAPERVRGGGLGGSEFARRGALLLRSATGRW